MDLTIVRHSISLDNSSDRVSGSRSDVDLSDAGIEYAKQVSGVYDWNQFDKVFSSPMKRAQQTTKILVGNQTEIEYDARIAELDFGDWDGVSEQLIYQQYPQVFDELGRFNRTYSDFAPNSESYADLVTRVSDFLDELKPKYADQSVLLVCHGMTTRALCSSLLGTDIMNFGIVGNVTLNKIFLDANDDFRPQMQTFNQKLV